MIRRFDLLLAAGAMVAVAGSPGCARKTSYPSTTLRGTVTVDGAPVPRGSITFSPSGPDHGPVVGTAIRDGRFECPHSPLGKLTTTFVLQAAEPRKFVDATGVERTVPTDILPPAYRAGVPIEVSAGQAELTFALVSTPPR